MRKHAEKPKSALVFLDTTWYKIGLRNMVFAWDGERWTRSTRLRSAVLWGFAKALEETIQTKTAQHNEAEMELTKVMRTAAQLENDLIDLHQQTKKALRDAKKATEFENSTESKPNPSPHDLV